MGAYGSSKLANILFTRALAKRLQGTGGHRYLPASRAGPNEFRRAQRTTCRRCSKRIFGVLMRFARSPEKGAETVIYLASSPQVQGASGGYYFDCKL